MQWTFERVVLLMTALLIVVCLGATFWLGMTADDLENSMRESQTMLATMGLTAQETFNLQDELRKDGVASGEGAYAYIDAQLRDSRIGKKFNYATPTTEHYDDYEDTRYTLTPSLAEYDFTREQIGKFLLYVELRTARMKVTRIRLDMSNRRGATSDDWKPTFVITDRRPVIEE